jgi:hypothetical protein
MNEQVSDAGSNEPGVGLSEKTMLNCEILEYVVTFEVKGSDLGRLNNLFTKQNLNV